MHIDELIEKLELYRKSYGDVDVMIEMETYPFDPEERPNRPIKGIIVGDVRAKQQDRILLF